MSDAADALRAVFEIAPYPWCVTDYELELPEGEGRRWSVMDADGELVGGDVGTAIARGHLESYVERVNAGCASTTPATEETDRERGDRLAVEVNSDAIMVGKMRDRVVKWEAALEKKRARLSQIAARLKEAGDE